MKVRARAVRRSMVCLLLGAATSVAVAWGIGAATGEPLAGPWTSRLLVRAPQGKPEVIAVTERRAFGRRTRWIGNSTADLAEFNGRPEGWYVMSDAGPAPAPSRVAWGDTGRDLEVLKRRRQYAFGFPLVCIWYERSGGLSMFGSAMRLQGGYEIASALKKQRTGVESYAALAYRPVWLGLGVNTMAYGGVWCLVLVAWGRVRARLRLGAGLCRKCRYDLSGLASGAPCPECGTASA
jgi:hypothetical protein